MEILAAAVFIGALWHAMNAPKSDSEKAREQEIEDRERQLRSEKLALQDKQRHEQQELADLKARLTQARHLANQIQDPEERQIFLHAIEREERQSLITRLLER
jgi:uncharacterized protein YlxW (UPF0749 family)